MDANSTFGLDGRIETLDDDTIKAGIKTISNDHSKSNSVRSAKKKDAEKALMNEWVMEKNTVLKNEAFEYESATSYNSHAGSDSQSESSQSLDNVSGQNDDQVDVSQVHEFVLTAVQPLSAQEVDDRVSIFINLTQTLQCAVIEEDKAIRICGDVHKLIHGKMQLIAGVIADLSQKLLSVRRDHLQLTDVLHIDTKNLSMNIALEVSMPSAYLRNGKGEELKICLSKFAQVLSNQDQWSDSLLNDLREGSGQYLATMAAKKLRQAKGETSLPEHVLECKVLGDAIVLGKMLGPAPRENEITKADTLAGAFRGFHRDERKSFFSPDGSVQGKSKTFQFAEADFERIRRLCTNELTHCSVDVLLHFIGERLDHIELLKIKGDINDMYQG
jgi:hypothetical protein